MARRRSKRGSGKRVNRSSFLSRLNVKGNARFRGIDHRISMGKKPTKSEQRFLKRRGDAIRKNNDREISGSSGSSKRVPSRYRKKRSGYKSPTRAELAQTDKDLQAAGY